MFVPWAALNFRHPVTDLCEKGAERNRSRMTEEEAWAGKMTVFRAYERPTETVLSFKYVWRLPKATDKNWLAVIANIWNFRKSWSCMVSSGSYLGVGGR